MSPQKKSSVSKKENKSDQNKLTKCPTGISGLDEVTRGGLPRGRCALISGGAGAGKTVLGMSFLVKGALDYEEPGVYFSFEESVDDLIENFSSIDWNLNNLVKERKVLVEQILVDPNEFQEAGQYNLEGVFLRLENAIDSIKAKRVVIDTSEVLFAGLSNAGIIRNELRRLFQWLKDKGVTTVITSEYSDNKFSRRGLDEFVSDCVIFLDHRMIEEVSTRRLRIIKYRGTQHETNEFPFIIGKDGIFLFPVTSVNLDHDVSEERISSGIEELDDMLAGEGYYRGSSILVTGTAGTGKSSLAAHFVDAACRRGELCLYFAFEESHQQLSRNMRSIGMDLSKWMKKGLLEFHAVRPSLLGLEMHLAKMQDIISRQKPEVVVVDPISNLDFIGSSHQTKLFWLRFIDFLKSRKVTTFFSCLVNKSGEDVSSTTAVSSLMDSWLSLRNLDHDGERNRLLYIVKSRGMAHSNELREVEFTDKGIKLIKGHMTPEGLLTGTARKIYEIRMEADSKFHQREMERKQRDIERKRQIMKANIAAVEAQFEAEKEEIELGIYREEIEEEKQESGFASVQDNGRNFHERQSKRTKKQKRE